MAVVWRGPRAFRADPAAAAAAAPRPSRRQAVALLTVLALVAGAVAVASYLVRPSRARAFDLFSGSLFLADSVAPVSVDLATGSPSVRLIDATAQVGATPQQSLQLGVVPLYDGGGTLLLDTATGEFNMVDATGFVIKRDGGVPLPRQRNSWAVGLSARNAQVPDLAYIEQSGATRTSVYLVSQATVREATSAVRVKPRASRTLDVAASSAPGAQTTANGDFWLLSGTGARRSVVQLSLPASSEANGAALRMRAHGTVSGPAALATATLGANPDSAATVGVASNGQIDVYPPSGPERIVRFTAPSGVTSILPATDQRGRLSYLLHAADGWSLVSVNALGGGLQGPDRIADIGSASDLVTPAQSGADLYTMDRTSGQLIRISPDAHAEQIPGAGTYPIATGKHGQALQVRRFDDAYVIARGSRVFYDSPSHPEALALFTDGSRPPYVIAKSAAVGLNAAGDASALSKAHEKLIPTKHLGHPQRPQSSTQPPKNVIPPAVNTTIDCQNTTQQPNIPQIYGVQPAARSVTFSWLYPRAGNEDCVPRTYVITAKLLSGNAPAAPGSVTVRDQQGTTLTGLYPDSSYELTVTAYLGSLSTSSQPVRVTTSPQGPDAAVDLNARIDSSGNWVLHWDSCGRAAADCVPSDSWQVEAQVCDGRGLIPSLTTLDVPADPTTRSQPSAVYPAGSALLGRGLSFRVVGRGIDNLPGTVSASTPCVTSWAPPIPSALSFTASAPSFTSFGTTTTATASLNLGADPIRDVGGLGAHVTFLLTGDGGTQTKGPFTVDGSHNVLSADFPGIAPGAQYTASAVVQPAHGGAPIVDTQQGITTRSQWPTITIDPGCDPGLLSCSFHLGINGITSAGSRGETFSFDDSYLSCGSNVLTFGQQNFDPANEPVVTAPLSQLDGYYGDCTVRVQLVEAGNPGGGPLVYGGTPSPVVTQSVSLGGPDQANLQKSDFTVQWDPQGSSNVQVLYNGSQNLNALTNNWSEDLQGPTGAPCGNTTQQPGGTPGTAAQIPIDPGCINLYGALPTPWTVTVTYHNQVGDTGAQTFTWNDLAGPPPGYTPCTVNGFTAAWGAALADGINVSVDPSSQLGGCSHWSYQLVDNSTTPPTQVCQVSTDPYQGQPPQPAFAIDLSTCGTPPTDTWELDVTYQLPDGTTQTVGDPLGPPPPS